MRIAGAGSGAATIALRFSEAFGNRKGDVHGGVIAGLVDIAMSEAIRSSLSDFRGLSTISMTVNYLDVGRGDLTASGKVSRAGKTTAFASAEVRDAQGRLVATGQGSFRIIR
jgi:uncharacterized protein (TIGR00369 family)